MRCAAAIIKIKIINFNNNNKQTMCVETKKCKHRKISTYLVIWILNPQENIYSNYKQPLE